MLCKIDGKTPQITLAHLIRRIGLHTNVSTKTRAQFNKKSIIFAMRLADEEVQYQKRKAEKGEEVTV